MDSENNTNKPVPFIKAINMDAYKTSKWEEKWFLFKEKYINSWWEYSWGYKLWNYKIIPFLFPRQKWLIKSIKKEWQDKVTLIPDVLYTMVIHFVEGEKALETINWGNSGLSNFEKELKEVYDWAKNGRKEFLDKILVAYPDVEVKIDEDGTAIIINKKTGFKSSHGEDYAEVNRLEKEFEEFDTKCLMWIIENRDYFWV